MTSIQWTDTTWNPCTGCDKISPGCKHCYAEGIAERFFAKQYPPNADGSPRKFTDVRWHFDRLHEPDKWRKPRMVFVNSMSDLFHEDVPDQFIDCVFSVMAANNRHTFQILTKRPERMRQYVSSFANQAAAAKRLSGVDAEDSLPLYDEDTECYIFNSISGNLTEQSVGWPLKNIWLGVSVENQKYANECIPLLLQTPAAIRFLSVEPMLEGIDFSKVTMRDGDGLDTLYNDGEDAGIDWVICGGESGPGARPFQIDWANSLLDQCRAAGVPFFMKQIGSNPHVYSGVMKAVTSWPGRKDSKGGTMEEWPPNIRVREFPRISA